MVDTVKLHDLEIREGIEDITPERIVTLYRRAPLHRNVGGQRRVWQMFEQATLVLTAWHRGHLVGVARVLSDGVMYSYVCDPAVEADVQRLGAGQSRTDESLTRYKGTEFILYDSDKSYDLYTKNALGGLENA